MELTAEMHGRLSLIDFYILSGKLLVPFETSIYFYQNFHVLLLLLVSTCIYFHLTPNASIYLTSIQLPFGSHLEVELLFGRHLESKGSFGSWSNGKSHSTSTHLPNNKVDPAKHAGFFTGVPVLRKRLHPGKGDAFKDHPKIHKFRF